MNTEEVVSKPSKGELFKKKHGYSKTMRKNMKKHDLDPHVYSDSLNEYRGIRKKRRKERKLTMKAKKDKIRAGRKVKGVATKK